MNNSIPTVSHPSAGQQRYGNYQPEKITTQNHNNSEDNIKVIDEVKKSRNTPTPLEYSCWSRHRTALAVCSFIVFTSIAMTIGVMTVYFSSPEIAVKKCEINFILTTENLIDYNYGPRSVAIGDFNSDTWLDIAVANHFANSITIYLGYSNGTFSSPTKYSTGSSSAPYMITVGDFNNDSRLDAAVANYGTNSIGIFLGFGNGSFESQIETSTGSSHPISITAANFNNDRLPDIVTADYGTHTASIYYGYGNGSFASPITYPTGYDSHPSSIATGDFNNDTYLDLAIANYGTHSIGILLGNENGSFLHQTTLRTISGSQPISLTLGHFDSDTFLDIAVANYGTNNIGIHRGNGNGTFLDQVIYPIGSTSPYSIGAGDFNQDNRLDLIVTSKGTKNIAILLGYGNGAFENPMTYTTGASSSTSFATGDFNKDNRLDVVVANNDTGAIDILFGYHEGFLTQMMYLTRSRPSAVVVSDFNDDTRLDIVVANFANKSVSVLLGHGNGFFAEQMTYSIGSNPSFIAVGDFNNDTRLDIIVTNSYNNNVRVLLGYGNGSFVEKMTFSTGTHPSSVTVRDFNSDSRLDIVATNLNNNSVSVLLGHGNGSFADQMMFSTDSEPQSVAVGDFNNDTRLDIVTTNYYSSSVSVLLGDGNGSFSQSMTYSTGAHSTSIAFADFNNDTRLDIAVTNSAANSVDVLLVYVNIFFINETILTTENSSQPRSFVIADFNNDNHMDIGVAKFGTHSIGIFLGYGNISFANQIAYSTGPDSSPQSIAAVDFNNDSYLDIVVANGGSDNIGIFLAYGNGSFAQQTTYSTVAYSSPRSIVVVDLNNDNLLDIAVANYGTNTLGVFIGHGNGTFARIILFPMKYGSNPFSIVVGDFNIDKKLDFAVANNGTKNLNTFYRLVNFALRV